MQSFVRPDPYRKWIRGRHGHRAQSCLVHLATLLVNPRILATYSGEHIPSTGTTHDWLSGGSHSTRIAADFASRMSHAMSSHAAATFPLPTCVWTELVQASQPAQRQGTSSYLNAHVGDASVLQHLLSSCEACAPGVSRPTHALSADGQACPSTERSLDATLGRE